MGYPMFDLIIRNANLPDGRTGVDIGIENGLISDVAPGLDARARREIDATGRLTTPPFVDSHFHLDSTLSYGQPRVNASGTLLEGIELWGELKPHLTVENIKARARELCHWAIARGTLAIRSHVDVSDDKLVAVIALLELRDEVKPYIDLQLVAFPQDGYYRHGPCAANLERALDLGVDVVGGIPHFERTMDAGAASVKALCEIAAERGQSMAQMALSWVLRDARVTSALIGASRVEQVRENMQAAEFVERFTPDVIEAVDRIFS